jgi:hypothetical protein
MKKTIGLNRVIEPKGVFPLVAWKLDNHREIEPGEVRIRVERIHLEWDNFQQILSSCGYQEAAVKARILDIIEKRGKLQNPFTGTGGVFLGQIEEIAEGFQGNPELSTGDKVYYVATLGAIPIHIDSIDSIDYKYGQLNCRGYAICFEQSPLLRWEPGLKEAFALAALDDKAHIARSVQMVNEGRRAYMQFFEQKGLEYVPSHTNFILVNVGNGVEVFRKALAKGVIMRPMAAYGLTQYIRITIGNAQENARCIEVLGELL